MIGIGIGALEISVVALVLVLVGANVARIVKPRPRSNGTSPAELLGALFLALVAIAPFAYCASQGGCRFVPGWSSDDDDRRERAEQESRESDEKAELRRLQSLLCTDTYDLFADAVLMRTEGHVAYVRPEALEHLDVNERTVLAGWVGVCKTKDGKAILRDGRTGETFALWGVTMGYWPQ